MQGLLIRRWAVNTAPCHSGGISLVMSPPIEPTRGSIGGLMTRLIPPEWHGAVLTAHRRISKPCIQRRRGREAEGGGLLNRYTVKSRIGGSNPPVSANSSHNLLFLMGNISCLTSCQRLYPHTTPGFILVSGL